MPWKEMSIMSSREEFVVLAQAPGANIRQLCRRFGISARTAYKWLARYAQAGTDGLQDQSRSAPPQSPADPAGGRSPGTSRAQCSSDVGWP